MTRLLFIYWQCTAMVLLLLWTGVTFAQVPAQEPAATATPDDAPDAASDRVETDPAVRAALELPRTTPADHFQAILTLIELGRPELAKPILAELEKLQLNNAERAALVGQFGPAGMLQLARAKELAPAGAQLADSCMAAADAAAKDPRRLAALVQQLTNPSAEVRVIARNDLAALGQPGVTATLEAIGREQDPSKRALLVTAAGQMSPLVERPLVAILGTADDSLRSDIADLLAQLQFPPAAPLIASHLSMPEQALEAALERHTKGTPAFEADEANQVELWYWNDATKKLVSRRFPADEAQIIWMARLARALANLRPDMATHQRRALLLELEASGLIGASQSAKQLIETSDNRMLDDVLSDALAAGYWHAAVAAADALGERRDYSVLYTGDSRPSPLAAALLSPNRRVRYASLAAIMAIDPQSPFPGSSNVPETLGWFATGTGERRALVAMPTLAAATDLAGKLAAHKIVADATNSGREAVELARAMADLEFILIDMNIQLPNVREVLYQLRANPETGEIPIALLAAEGRFDAGERLAEEHQRMIAVPRPHWPEVIARLMEGLSRVARRDTAPPAERAAQAVQATAWLAKLAAAETSFYDLHRAADAIETALFTPTSSQSAIAALAKLGTPQSQRALLDFLAQPSLPMASRTQAAQAFRDSTVASGVLLTSDEILAQYDRYNASANADAATQQLYGSVLDAIEARRDARHPDAPPVQ
jgi:CheY-like chemotaxis protein